MKKIQHVSMFVLFSVLAFGVSTAFAFAYTQTDFVAFDGVNIGTNSYTVSSDITATYTSGTGTVSDPVKLTLTGNAPIVTPWFGPSWTTYNYVTIGIKLPAGFSGTSVYDAGVIRYDNLTTYPDGYYSMGTGSTDLATAGAALGYLDFSFAANSTNTKKDGLVKLQVIWNATSTPEYFTIDINGLQLDTLTDKFVSTIEQLRTALADTNVTTINITANISAIPATLVVPVGHPVTINGGGYTLTFTGLESFGSVDDGFMIQAPTTINNLTVDAGLATPTTWVGTYAIQVYNTTATLNNVTATNGNGGILGNNSTVTLTGAINVSGNGFGGIESSGASASLNVSGVSWTNTSEAYGLPTIWEDGLTGDTVINYEAFTRIIKGEQYQYYLIAGNSVDPAVAALALFNATAAVVTAEGSHLQADVNAAQLLVTALPNGAAKTALQARIDAVQAAINAAAAAALALTNATTAVVLAETTPTQGNVNAAQILVTALPEGADKTALQNRINAVQAIINPAIPPANKDQCKNDGWKTFTNPVFKNQGECVSYVEKQKDNDKHDDHKDNKDNKDSGHGDKNNKDDKNHETNNHGHSVEK